MKTSITSAALGLLLLASSAAYAGGNVSAAIGGGSYEIDVDDGSDVEADDIAGFDLRGHFEVSPNVFLRVGYLTTSGDEVEIGGTNYSADTDIDVVRMGAGYGSNAGSIRVYGAIEYVDFQFGVEGDDDSSDGVGLTAGLSDQGLGNVMWSVELSILALDDLEGGRFDARLGYRFTPMFAAFVGLESYALEDDYDAEFSMGHVFLGGTLSF